VSGKPQAPRPAHDESPRPGTLYVVATPIGNLDDLSPRAVACLRACSVIACEDTRRTRILATRFDLRARLLSCHKFNEAEQAAGILDVLGHGNDVALVSDGGTPAVSDPGAHLVRRVRAAGHRIVPIPGASAVTALLSVSGFHGGPFTFIGFLPHRQSERRRTLESIRRETRSRGFFESPLRLTAMLEDTRAILGEREVLVGREMTKIHEEFLSGPISSVIGALAGRAIKGEVTLLVSGAEAGPAGSGAVAAEGDTAGAGPPEPAAAAVRRLVEAGWDRKEAMRRVARERGLSRRDVYNQVMKESEAKRP
jgi:16S rRNA (cytidine1402-2'-O)-methyltransferase